jgi:DegT/DnrJ/EryC1/StrS aminotransferase family
VLVGAFATVFMRRSSYHLYVVMADRAQLGISRDELLNRMAAQGVGAGVHFHSLTVQKFYREKYGFQPGDSQSLNGPRIRSCRGDSILPCPRAMSIESFTPCGRFSVFNL